MQNEVCDLILHDPKSAAGARESLQKVVYGGEDLTIL
jgi:hypothetical protein